MLDQDMMSFAGSCVVYIFNEIEHRRCIDFQPFISSIKYRIVLCHCAFEAKSDSEIFVNAIGKFASFKTYSAHDCAAVLHVLATMQESRVNIRFDNSGIRENQVRELADIIAGKKRNATG